MHHQGAVAKAGCRDGGLQGCSVELSESLVKLDPIKIDAEAWEESARQHFFGDDALGKRSCGRTQEGGECATWMSRGGSRVGTLRARRHQGTTARGSRVSNELRNPS